MDLLVLLPEMTAITKLLPIKPVTMMAIQKPRLTFCSVELVISASVLFDIPAAHGNLAPLLLSRCVSLWVSIVSYCDFDDSTYVRLILPLRHKIITYN